MQSNKDIYGFIYLTTNLINYKKYIGQHTNLCDQYLGSGKLLLQDIKKFGKCNFCREILAVAYSKVELNQLEIQYIAQFNAVKRSDFYNIHVGGCGGNTRLGYTLEEEQQYRKKMRIISLHNNYRRIGRKRSLQEKINISLGCKKRWKNITPQQRQHFVNIMHNAVLGIKNPNFNHKWSLAKKQQFSKYLKSINHSKGTKNPNYGNTGDKAKNGKAIYMYDKNLNFIRRFNTKQQVLHFLNMKGHTQLNYAIKNNILFKEHYWYMSLLNV